VSIKTILTDNAPKPIGPYSQGLAAGDFIFTSGQIGIDPATGNLVTGGIEAETRRVFDNITAILAAGGSALAQVVKVSVYLVDLADFEKMNKIYQEYFKGQAPVRTTVGVAALPKAARIEIDVIAINTE
jgi:reactive intermediate/imine deaminase